jgi:hypothetical protein
MVLTLSEDKTERWRDLCKQAENEKDPAKLLALVQEIDRLLEARREWQRKSGAPINDT